MLEYAIEHRLNWANEIENLLNRLNMSEQFENRESANMCECKKKIWKLMEEENLENINNKLKLSTYAKLKDNIEVQEYVTGLLSKEKRSLMIELRCGVLPIALETGRFKNKKDETSNNYGRLRPEERLCEICNSNAVEDEFHFVMKCEKYKLPRLCLFDAIGKSYTEFSHLNSDEDKFVFILNRCWKECTRKIGKASLYGI